MQAPAIANFSQPLAGFLRPALTPVTGWCSKILGQNDGLLPFSPFYKGMEVNVICYSMHDNDFTAADFLADNYFREWILAPNKENRLYWESWLMAHPGLQAELDLACRLMAQIQINPHTLSQNKVNQIWAAIEAEVTATEGSPVSREASAPNQTKGFNPACLALAGTVLLGLSLTCLGLVILLNKRNNRC